ncbi:Di-copper centre-containing [Lecanosticta acicola]|uniref:Di-copper centre-containing n=1 Tax=Lecanosticta acicola TaxID=111012 RepID=A0AAI9E826_9PEZI|nr:Di-copper centre-containing [Lecanosticta acicola]
MLKLLSRSALLICALFALVLVAGPRGAYAATQDAFTWETFQAADVGLHSLSSEELSLSQDVSAGDAFNQIKSTYRDKTQAILNQGGGCNSKNVAIRREWSTLSPDERHSFIAAFKCLLKHPGSTPRSMAPGARNRLDDYVVAHITQMLTVHFSPWQFLWHRQMLFLIEKELRELCGYTAYLPYWEWPKHADLGISGDPIFDGSSTSLSGDGDRRSDNCSCVTTGPMADWTVNLGPQGGKACSSNPRDDALGYNHRCLERRMDKRWLANMTYDNIVQTIQGSSDINALSKRIDAAKVGLHTLGHTFVGGLQNNIPAAASDALFYCHHSMMDYLYSMWQAQDFKGRQFAIADPSTYKDIRLAGWGDAPHVTLESTIYLSPMFPNITARDATSPTGGQFCYMYE